MISAVFFPIRPEALAFDLVQEARAAIKSGQKLFSNGHQLALLPANRQKDWEKRGWQVFGANTRREDPPCAA